MTNDLTTYQIYLTLLGYLSEQNDDKAQMMVSMLGELHKRADKVENEDELKDLSKRVEALENQMKEDEEIQLKKLEADLDYAKFRLALPTIQHMMGDEI